MKQIPNIFTLLNLVFGCLAIIFILQFHSGEALSSVFLITGSVFIFLAGIVDFLDGFIARMFKATSAMGAQLDSLSDVVSFGVAPGMIMYKLLEHSFSLQKTEHTFYLLLPALLIPCAAAWRLAKFNLDKEQQYYFKGVPVPASAIVIASFPLILTYDFWGSLLRPPSVLYSIIVLMCILMVSNLPMTSLKFKDYRLHNNISKIVLLVIVIVSAIFFRWAAVVITFIGYVIVSLIFKPNKI